MKSYIHWADDDSEVEAEIQSEPKPSREPMSEERFNTLVRLAEIAIVAAATVACTIVEGFPGMLFAGMFDVVLAAFTFIE